MISACAVAAALILVGNGPTRIDAVPVHTNARAAHVFDQCLYQDCAGYCDGSCPYRPNISTAGTEDLTVYRMTPYNVTGVLQHDTGDVRGDLGFLLVKYLDSSMCSPPYNTRECFLDDHTIVGAFNVTFDGAYGPYLKCNPNTIEGTRYVNTSDFFCAYGYPPGSKPGSLGPWVPDGAGCPAPCQRVNVSVGKDPTMHRFSFPEWSLIHAFGGYWYDTVREGECLDGHVPGDGSGCTWIVRDTPVYINATCLVGRLFAVVEKANTNCFGQCPPNSPPTSTCYQECFESTIRDALVSTETLVAEWEAAFGEGGCPHFHPARKEYLSLAR